MRVIETSKLHKLQIRPAGNLLNNHLIRETRYTYPKLIAVDLWRASNDETTANRYNTIEIFSKSMSRELQLRMICTRVPTLPRIPRKINNFLPIIEPFGRFDARSVRSIVSWIIKNRRGRCVAIIKSFRFPRPRKIAVWSLYEKFTRDIQRYSRLRKANFQVSFVREVQGMSGPRGVRRIFLVSVRDRVLTGRESALMRDVRREAPKSSEQRRARLARGRMRSRKAARARSPP